MCIVQVKLRNPLRTRVIPERFCGGDSLRRGAITSVCTFTFYLYIPNTHHNEVIAISTPPYYVVGADNNVSVEASIFVLCHIFRLTPGRDWFTVWEAAEQAGSVENLVHDDGEAVDVSFLRAAGDDLQAVGSRPLRCHQLRSRPQQRYSTETNRDNNNNNNNIKIILSN